MPSLPEKKNIYDVKMNIPDNQKLHVDMRPSKIIITPLPGGAMQKLATFDP